MPVGTIIGFRFEIDFGGTEDFIWNTGWTITGKRSNVSVNEVTVIRPPGDNPIITKGFSRSRVPYKCATGAQETAAGDTARARTMRFA